MTFLHEPERGDKIIYNNELYTVKDYPSNNGNFKAEDERGRLKYFNTVFDTFTFVVNGYENRGRKPGQPNRITPSRRSADNNDYEAAIIARQDMSD